MTIGVVVFLGTNCERDCFYAIKNCLGEKVKYLWHEDTNLDGIDCLILPGGFSYGDYLRAGAIARFSPIMQKIFDFAYKGGIIVGICNGFQILLEADLLPGAMLRNKTLHFICKYVYIRVENNHTPFTNLCKKYQVLKIPIAHNHGNYYLDNDQLRRLEENNQVVFRYCNRAGLTEERFNPNGAVNNIAGIINKEGNILGMMPHPERSCEEILGSTDGLLIFNSILQWLKKR